MISAESSNGLGDNSQMEIFRPFVYGLVDPTEPKHVRYVGMASVRTSRPMEHSKNAHGKRGGRIPHLAFWIRKLHSEGREYIVLTLETLPEGTPRQLLGFVEKCYIKSLREIGHDLINVAEGGDGGKMGEMSIEARVALNLRMLGDKNTQGMKRSVESRRQQSDSARKYFAEHPEAAEQSAVSRTGLKPSSVTRERMSRASKGHHRGVGLVKHSKEFKDNISARSLGNTYGVGAVHSKESCMRRAESLRRYNADLANQETIASRRARQSATMKALHAKKKAESE